RVVVDARAGARDGVVGLEQDAGIRRAFRPRLDIARPMRRPEHAGAARLPLRHGLEPGPDRLGRRVRAQQFAGEDDVLPGHGRNRSAVLRGHVWCFPPKACHSRTGSRAAAWTSWRGPESWSALDRAGAGTG